MNEDLRGTELYREVEALYRQVWQPGAKRIGDAADVHVAPDGRRAVFAGTIVGELEGLPPTRVCEADLASGRTRTLTDGPHTDRLPRYAPDGLRVAFLSDRHERGDFQLHFLDRVSGAVEQGTRVEGSVEYLRWSPDGTHILLGVVAAAGPGARPDAPSWIAKVEREEPSNGWRHAYVYELATHRVRRVGPAELNVWEAVWCGNAALAVIVSQDRQEGQWYSARLELLDIGTGDACAIREPRYQLGCLAASPDARYLAFVEGLCSDRSIVAGDLHLAEVTQRAGATRIDTNGVDISYAEWRSNQHLLLAGYRGLETVVGLLDVRTRTFTQVWASRECSTSGPCAIVAGCGSSGDCVLIAEGFGRAPELAVIRAGQYHAVTSFDLGYGEHARVSHTAEALAWKAPDGREIEGWLLRPKGDGPYPLVTNIHGGPVWHWRPHWLGRRAGHLLTLLARGYAIFLPNPRGSSGHGQDFARRVLGDMGGADMSDCLSGIDHLLAQRVADPRRLGVMGASYGGYMSAWLITQDPRFAAAVPVAPAINRISQHLTSNIPQFVRLFLADDYSNAAGRYIARSPVMYAHNARTPTLIICGALDRCTPPTEALQFHRALREHGTESVLVTYPEEAHGIRHFPAVIDFGARVVDWFLRWMPQGEWHGR